MEVKSQSRGKTAFFGEHQKEALLKAYDFGLTPMLLIVPLNLNIEIGEPQLKEITKNGEGHAKRASLSSLSLRMPNGTSCSLFECLYCAILFKESHTSFFIFA